VFVIYLLPSHNKYRKFNKIPPKAAILLLVATISGQKDTSIAKSLDADLQPIIREQL